MTDLLAYGLRAEYDGTVEIDGQTVPVFLGGVIAVDGADFNVRQHLDEADGAIVIDASHFTLVNALDEYPALKRIGLTPGMQERYEALADERTITQLRAELRARSLPTTGTRAELIARLADPPRAIVGDAGVAGQPDVDAGAATPDDRQES
jgi:hypothetical protein